MKRATPSRTRPGQANAERKRADEELRKAPLYARSLLEASLDPLVTISREGEITDVNQATEKVTGISREKLIGSDFSNYFTDPGSARRGYEQVFAQGAVQDYPLAIRSAAGRVTDVLYNATVFKNEAGEVAGVFAAARDITERKRADEIRELLAAVVDSSDDAIISKTLGGTITAWNSGAERLFGYSASEILGKPIQMLMPPERANEEQDILARIVRGERVQHFETIRIRKDGRKIEVSATISPIKDSRGVIVGASKIARDITERKRAERALRSLSNCNESLMRATDEMTLLQQICDLVVNVGGYRMAWVGYAEHNEKKTIRAVAQSGFEAGYLDTLNITWADEEHGRGPGGTAIRSGKPVVCLDTMSDPRVTPWREEAIKRGYRSIMVLPLKSGEEVLGALAIYATEVGAFDDAEQHLLEELSNNLSYGITSLRARQDRQRAEEDAARKAADLARSNADLEQFAYVASHDLQEPLRMITAYTQLLAERYKGKLDENADKFIGYASEGALRMQVLIQDLLAFSRVGRNGTASASVDCNAVMEEVRKTLGTAIQESGTLITHGKLPAIWVDRTQITQVFQNLIGNAIKFRGKEPPVISVEAEELDHQWLCRVSDNGIGIAPEYAENIFVAFHRLHARTEYPGNGIGLAICKKIVEHYGGRIWVEPRAGSGSTFKFTMPVLAPDSQKEAGK
ncbi:MAG TPA: PAS domain S-box protein [Candidatus Eremiobacteraceae bacterium]|nr:PAS domain S-box protein [Candidatus Eremiobacteraceae bacterium]